MKSLNKKVSKAVSALAVAIALVGCDSGGGGDLSGLALAGLGGDTTYAKASILAKVQKTGPAALGVGSAATTVRPEVAREAVFVKISTSHDFTTTSSAAGTAAGADNGDFAVVVSVPSQTATLKATVYTLRELTCEELDKSRSAAGNVAAAWDVDTTGGRCGLYNSGVAASDERRADYDAILDKSSNYTTVLGTFELQFNIDPSDTTLPGTVTVINESGVDITPANGQTDTPYAVVAIVGEYSNPNATVGENKCDSIGNPTILSGTITSNRTLGAFTLLRGTVFVKNGATVTVPAGAVVYGERGSSLFFVGGSLVTNGTAANPVCFTSAQARGSRFPGDWGGITIVGSGNNTRAAKATTEGTTPQAYPLSSGTGSATLNYTIVEFAGTEVAVGDELNGISQYAVNSGNYNFVQVHRGLDDSYEWWGGGNGSSSPDNDTLANVATRSFRGKFMIGSGSMDDDFDMDEGFSGALKYIVSVKYPKVCGGSPSTDPGAMEMDGNDNSTTGKLRTLASYPNNSSNPYVDYYTLLGVNENGSYAERHREGMLGKFQHGLAYGFKQNIKCENTAGFSASSSVIDTLVSDTAPTADSAGSCTSPGRDQTLVAAPVVSIADTQANCGFLGFKPDLQSVAAQNTRGGVPAGTLSDFDGTTTLTPTGGNTWYSGWTVWRAR
ncbi:hypothetical protein [Leptospira andrefontaineae]|uniref:Lipoprotein n=1 Tax=Leptospira andrefontaineae TaxID=2484976 RepID=A0A4R9HA64_9LEPT|nr:hypothetical protein [Leptospira andrefontaineae]TGK43417.1 hypothetical protein EHO65_01875 [Leptospira andrefontaineae]